MLPYYDIVIPLAALAIAVGLVIVVHFMSKALDNRSDK